VISFRTSHDVDVLYDANQPGGPAMSTTPEKTNVERVWDATSRRPMTRKEIAYAAGVNVQAVTAAVNKLIDGNAVEAYEFPLTPSRGPAQTPAFVRVKGVRSLPKELRPAVKVKPVGPHPFLPTMGSGPAVGLCQMGGCGRVYDDAIHPKGKPARVRKPKTATAVVEPVAARKPRTNADLRAEAIGLGLEPPKGANKLDLVSAIAAKRRADRAEAAAEVVEAARAITPDPKPAAGPVALEAMSRPELAELAESLDVRVLNKHTRTELTRLIRDARAAAAPETAVTPDPAPTAPATAPATAPVALRTMSKDELVAFGAGIGLALTPSSTKRNLVGLITAKRRALKAEADAASVGTAVIVNGVVQGGATAPPAQDDAAAPDPVDGDAGTPDAVEAVNEPATAGRTRSVGGHQRQPGLADLIVKGNKATQWPRGGLAAAIAAVFDARGPEVDFTATDMTRTINEARTYDTDPIAQAGAVKYALEAMVKAGSAVRTSEAPKRYTRALSS
jgi:hypothetical protein